MKINKNNGFTLVELVLVLGIIAVASISAYLYMSKKTELARASLNGLLITKVGTSIQGMVKGYELKGNLNIAKNNVDQLIVVNKLISQKVIPTEMVSGANIVTIYGGNITINTSINQIPNTNVDTLMLNMNITSLNSSNCTDIMSSRELLDSANIISIGGAVIKQLGDKNISANLIGNACRASNAITVSYILFESTKADTSGEQCTDCGNARSAENLYHITSGVTNTQFGSKAPDCGDPLEAIWSSTNSVCTCLKPDAQWNGFKCVRVWTPGNTNNSGFCPLGYGWNRSNQINQKCVKLIDQSKGSAVDYNSETRLKTYLNTPIPSNKYYRPTDPILYPTTLDSKVPKDLIFVGPSLCPTCLNPNTDISITNPVQGTVSSPQAIAADPNSLSGNYTTNPGRFIPPSVPLGGKVDFKSNQNIQQSNVPLQPGAPVNTPVISTSGFDGASMQKCIMNGGNWDPAYNRCALPFANTLDQTNTDYKKSIESVKLLDACIRQNKHYTYNQQTGGYDCL